MQQQGNKPPNNDCLQMLRDLMAAADDTGQPELRTQAASLLQTLMASQEALDASQQAETKFRYREYADIHYSRQTVISADTPEPAVLQGLTAAACKIMLLLQTWAQSQYIQVSVDDMVLLSGLAEKTLKKAVRELKDHNLLNVAKPAVRHDPPVYRLSSAVVCTGKQRTTAPDRKNAVEAAVADGTTLIPQIDIVKCPDDEVITGGRYVRVSVTEPPWTNSKKPTSAGNADAGYEIIDVGSIVPESTTPVNENLLTPEEEDLFHD